MPIEDVLSVQQLHLMRQRQRREDEMARHLAHKQPYGSKQPYAKNRIKTGNEGLRLRLDPIPGLTKGDALRVLPYFFQCPPLDSFSVPRQRNHGSYQDYRGNEYLTRGGLALQQITIRTLAVEWAGFALVYDFDVQALVDDLHQLVVAGYPFKLTASHKYNRRPEIRRDMVLESVIPTENAGEPDARYLDLSFRQWRTPVADRRSRRPPRNKFHLPMTVTVKANGDVDIPGKGIIRDATLADVAKKVYGRPSFARHIMKAQQPRWVWAMHMQIIKAPRYKKTKGGKLFIPMPPDEMASGRYDDNYLAQLTD